MIFIFNYFKKILESMNELQLFNFLRKNNIDINRQENKILFIYIKNCIGQLNDNNVKEYLYSRNLMISLKLKKQIYELIARFI